VYLSRYSDGLWAGQPGLKSRQGQGFFLLHSIQTDSGAHPISYTMETGSISRGVKRPEREPDHSPPPSAKVKSDGAIAPLPHTWSDNKVREFIAVNVLHTHC
jgi:hypothetical protein